MPVITVESDQAPSSPSSDIEEQSSGDSQGTDVLVVENSLVSTSRSKDPIVLQKVGELLSNMHILLLKKALKRLKEQSNGIATNLNVKLKGAVVSRGFGTATCIYEIPFLNIEDHRIIDPHELASVEIQNDINVPLPDVLCSFFQSLLTDDVF